MWGDEIGIQDELSWFEAIKSSNQIKQAGAWFSLVYEDGEEVKFQASKWINMLKDKKFRNRVLQLMEQEIVMRFDKRQGEASEFYNLDEEETLQNSISSL